MSKHIQGKSPESQQAEEHVNHITLGKLSLEELRALSNSKGDSQAQLFLHLDAALQELETCLQEDIRQSSQWDRLCRLVAAREVSGMMDAYDALCMLPKIQSDSFQVNHMFLVIYLFCTYVES